MQGKRNLQIPLQLFSKTLDRKYHIYVHVNVLKCLHMCTHTYIPTHTLIYKGGKWSQLHTTEAEAVNLSAFLGLEELQATILHLPGL